jgi:hypothetical protein
VTTLTRVPPTRVPKRLTTGRVDQLADLFRTTHKVKTQQVVKSRGQHCGDVELAGYLANAAGPIPLVLDLRIVMTVSEVHLTLVLMDTYTTLWI